MYQNYQSQNTFADQTINDNLQKIQLFLSGRNLLDLDFFSKSDPYVKVFFKKNYNQKEVLIGKTEVVDNNLNPNFLKTFLVDYIFQAKQEIKFQVYDYDDGTNDDFIGSVRTTIGALAGAKNQTTILDLQNAKAKGKPGKLIIRVEPCSQDNKHLRMKWKARKLMNTDSFFDFWDKSDPYLKFLKIRNDNTYIQANRTEIIMDNLNPNWKQIQIPVGRLISQNSQDGKFKIQCWDWQEAGQNKHQFIGQLFLNLPQLQSLNKYPIEYQLFNPKHKKPGYLILQSCEIITRPTFMDYLRGGLELNLSIAIDFTGSNGIPTHPTSLHYMNPQKPNQYQIAIDAVSRILLNYDSDKKIPAFGFGAKPRFPNFASSVVSHCFPLSGVPGQIEAFGYEHLMALYNRALQNVEFSGPTYFAPLLKQALNLANQNYKEGSNVYQILLILTDGEIHDMQLTVDFIVNNCNLPLSIIIVGVGNAEFTNMVRLDGDNGLYNSQGRKATRDIVQFVPFRQVQMNPDLLAQQLLAQLPTQVTQYMANIGKAPGKPIAADIEYMLNQHNSNNNIPIKPQQVLKNQLQNIFNNLSPNNMFIINNK